MKVLALSPHTDDIELGAGGFLSKLHEQGHDIRVIVFSDCSNIWDLPLREECQVSLNYVTANYVIAEVSLREFHKERDVILNFLAAEEVPDIVLLPSKSDIHQDHQVIHSEGVRAFSRKCSVLGYEMPYNCRGFKPNFFVELKAKHISSKLKMLESYKSQIDLNRPYFDAEFIRGHARSRGLQVKKEFAEAFEVITWIS